MDFSNLSDVELELGVKAAVLDENRAKTKVLHLLTEIERRRLYRGLDFHFPELRSPRKTKGVDP
jgi:hypothetical protein